MKKITAVNFTFALPGGMWIEFEDGSRNWYPFDYLIKMLGVREEQRIEKIAYHNGWCGVWLSV